MTEGQKSASVAVAQEAEGGFNDEVAQFASHCAYIRTVFILTIRIWRDSTEEERKTMEGVAPIFFLDMGQVLAEYVILAACRITDPAKSGNYDNFTVELFVQSFQPNSQTFNQLNQLSQTMNKLRAKILPARNKLIAHADRDAIRKNAALGHATWPEWDEFWAALKTFVRVLHEKVLGSPFDIDVAGVNGDAEMLIKAFRQSGFFEKLIAGGNSAARDAALGLALGEPR